MQIEICFAQPFLHKPFVVDYLFSRFRNKNDIGCTLSIVSFKRSNICRLDGIIASPHWTIFITSLHWTIIIITGFTSISCCTPYDQLPTQQQQSSAHSFPRASLSENCSLLGIDNVRGEISEHIFAPNEGYCLYITINSPPNNFFGLSLDKTEQRPRNEQALKLNFYGYGKQKIFLAEASNGEIKKLVDNSAQRNTKNR